MTSPAPWRALLLGIVNWSLIRSFVHSRFVISSGRVGGYKCTGCVKAPFPAESQAANRTHFFFSRFNSK